MKHILVHLDASPRAAVRLDLAQQLATRHEARLTALYGVMPGLLASPWPAGEGMLAMVSQLAELDVEQRARAQALVAQAAARAGLVAPQWVDGGQSPYWSLMQHAPYADLVVLGQHDGADAATGVLPPDLVPGVLCDGGRPTLVVPCVGTHPARPARVLIAWKPTREAARALAASLPWLRLAEQVDVALRPENPEGEFDHVRALLQWLQWQGVQAPVQVHRPAAGEIGESLLSLAADAGSEMLVMGCYGHSRAHEWALGGATRSILRSMTLPVLMAH